VCNYKEIEVNEMLRFIENIDNETMRKYDLNSSIYNKEKKCKCGNVIKTKKSVRCDGCRIINNRKVKNRPSIKKLLKEIKDTNYSAVGRKYGVSDNCIRKWIKN
jgi:hypothetical protein